MSGINCLKFRDDRISLNDIILGGYDFTDENIFLNFDANGNLFSYIENDIEMKIREDLGENCYDFIDLNEEKEGVYSAMWVHVEFVMEGYFHNGNVIKYPQTSGPLIFPNSFPFARNCPDNGEKGVEIDCSDALSEGMRKV